MKPYYLHDMRSYKPPFGTELQLMTDTTAEHRVVFDDGASGFVFGDIVFAPFYKKGDCIVKKDGHSLVLTYKEMNRFGVVIYKMPFELPCEPLSFRKRKIHKDTFLFRVTNCVTMCRAFPMLYQEGKFEINQPDHFCPVFDRFGHLIGINAGLFCKERICIPVHLLL